MRTTTIAATAAALLAAAPLAAQRTPRGRLEGSIRASLASRAAHGVKVWLVQLESQAASMTYNASADEHGRYHVDSLPAGRYLVQVSHPTLDSLDVALAPGQATIAEGQTTRTDLSLPSGAELRALVCPGVSLAPDKAVLAGHVVNSDDDEPIDGARVIAVWTDIVVDKKPVQIRTEKRMAVAKTGRRGEYRMCGIPAGKTLTLQLQHEDRVGATTQLVVTKDEGVAVRDLSLSRQSAPTITVVDSLERVVLSDSAHAVRPELALRGHAMLTGTVRSESGQPVPGVELHVRDAAATALTDDDGRFSLSELPSGTQVLVARRLGFSSAEVAVELRADRRATRDVRLTRAVELDSMRVTASRRGLEEFEYNRRTNPLGRFLTMEEIQARNPRETSELLLGMGGYTMLGRGRNAKMLLSGVPESGTAAAACRGANVVIQGVEFQSVNDVLPRQIAGMEVYRAAASASLQYQRQANCGLIVIWLRPGPRRRVKEPKVTEVPSLQYNGYP